MINVTFIDSAGVSHVCNGPAGNTLMEVAKNHDVESVYAECGGAGTCGTCQVYVREEWLGTVTPISPDEDEMLEIVRNRRPNSRLACQIVLSEAMDGLVVDTPQEQGLE